MAGLGFPRSARLLRRAEFVAVRQQGRSFAAGPLAASWRPREQPAAGPGMEAPSARVGLTVSSKVGGAVVRNRVKRRLREAVRHEIAGLPAVDLVVVARSSAVKAGVAELRAWLRGAAERMRKERAG
ncbi:MAG TPA: ribonuclease P protein component [Myxococcales bacterium]|nr:ribonuclease P protein component [Myxococcales bacterium]